MGWKMVKLGDVLEKVKSPRAGEESYPVLSITRSEGLVNQDERFGKRIASASTKDYKVVFRNELVVGFPIDEGVIDFQQLYEKAIVSPAYGIWRVTNPERVDLSFLARFLRSDRAIFYYQAKMRGTTARRRSLPDSLFLELPVPLPPLEEQQRIAKILGTVEEAIRAEEQSISKLETLAKNLAPETNRTVPVGEYVERIVSGKSIKEHSTSGGPRVLKISSTTSGYFKPEESKPLDPSYEPLSITEYKKGTYSFLGPTPPNWWARLQSWINPMRICCCRISCGVWSRRTRSTLSSYGHVCSTHLRGMRLVRHLPVAAEA